MMFRRTTASIAGMLLLATAVSFGADHRAMAGGDAPHPSALCLAAIDGAQQRYATPPGLLAVMSKVESGRPAPPSGALQPWPWTVDADGQGMFFPDKQEAVTWSRQALASGAVTYLDVGCMQIDLRMHPAAFRDLEEAFDPTANALYGARYLRELHDGAAAGNWFTAVGMYHSQT
ncbi:MAG: lytic transglycosylase domain-containing protein, partial [Acetobacteraceae bacterium]